MIDPKNLQAFANSTPKIESYEGSDIEDEDEEGNEDRLGDLRPIAEAHADDFAELHANLSPEVLDDAELPLTDEDRLVLESDFAFQDPEFCVALAAVPDFTAQDGADLGEHLEENGFVTDGASVGAWLYRFAGVVAALLTDEAGEDEADEAQSEEAEEL